MPVWTEMNNPFSREWERRRIQICPPPHPCNAVCSQLILWAILWVHVVHGGHTLTPFYSEHICQFKIHQIYEIKWRPLAKIYNLRCKARWRHLFYKLVQYGFNRCVKINTVFNIPKKKTKIMRIGLGVLKMRTVKHSSPVFCPPCTYQFSSV